LTQTYEEPIGRYVVEKLENYASLPQHRASLRINGIDPDENWLLVWSFDNKDLAVIEAFESEERDTLKRKWRWRDRGENAPRTITRTAWF
jgi:hypothetical protein